MHREGLTISVTRKASELPSKPGEWGQELGDPAARQGAGSPGAVETARRTSLLPSGLSEGPHAGVQSGTATSGFGELPTSGDIASVYAQSLWSRPRVTFQLVVPKARRELQSQSLAPGLGSADHQLAHS